MNDYDSHICQRLLKRAALLLLLLLLFAALLATIFKQQHPSPLISSSSLSSSSLSSSTHYILLEWPKSGRTFTACLLSSLRHLKPHAHDYETSLSRLLAAGLKPFERGHGFEESHGVTRRRPPPAACQHLHHALMRPMQITAALVAKAFHHHCLLTLREMMISSSSSSNRSTKIALVVRDPRDVAASLFYEARYRELPYTHGQQLRLILRYSNASDWIVLSARRPGQLHATIESMLLVWSRWLDTTPATPPTPRHLHIVRYESLHNRSYEALHELASFMGIRSNERTVADAYRLCDFNRLHELSLRESSVGAWTTTQKNQNQAQSLKARRGSVGGFRHELSAAAQAIVSRQLEQWRSSSSSSSSASSSSLY